MRLWAGKMLSGRTKVAPSVLRQEPTTDKSTIQHFHTCLIVKKTDTIPCLFLPYNPSKEWDIPVEVALIAFPPRETVKLPICPKILNQLTNSNFLHIKSNCQS